MAEATRIRLWFGRCTFLLLAAVLIFVQLLPRETLPPEVATPGAFLAALIAGEALQRVFVWPDLLLAVVLVWVIRRPEHLPTASVAGLMFLTDLLFQRPPGLWAALVLILTEMLRNRAAAMRTLPFMFEWGSVTLGIVTVTLVNRAVLALTVTPQAGIALTLSQMVATSAVYPLIAGAAALIFGVTRPGPGKVDAFGKRV